MKSAGAQPQNYPDAIPRAPAEQCSNSIEQPLRKVRATAPCRRRRMQHSPYSKPRQMQYLEKASATLAEKNVENNSKIPR